MSGGKSITMLKNIRVFPIPLRMPLIRLWFALRLLDHSLDSLAQSEKYHTGKQRNGMKCQRRDQTRKRGKAIDMCSDRHDDIDRSDNPRQKEDTSKNP